jgi:hypothetical protein
MSVTRSIVDQKEYACTGQMVDEAIQQGLGLVVDPVQILKDDDEGWIRLSRSKSSWTACSNRRRRCGGSSRSHPVSSISASKSHSSAGSAGSSLRSTDRSLPVTFSRTTRALSCGCRRKYDLRRSMTGSHGVARPKETDEASSTRNPSVRFERVNSR